MYKRRRYIGWSVLVGALAVVALIHVFALTSCYIPSKGMENSLYEGERVLIDKWRYGLRLPFTARRIGYRIVKRGDVVLFNNPAPSDPDRPIWRRPVFISRCVGAPGDTLMLDSELTVSSRAVRNPDSKSLYYYPCGHDEIVRKAMQQVGVTDTTLVGYSEGRYIRSWSHYEYYLMQQTIGQHVRIVPVSETDTTRINPLVIPRRGMRVRIYPWNAALMCNTIIRHEHRRATLHGDTLCVDGKPVRDYVFENDYYWMAANNPVNLFDSRLFGLVPHSHVIGKAWRIWYPCGWNRFFQRVQ